jgi:hypothetical protein
MSANLADRILTFKRFQIHFSETGSPNLRVTFSVFKSQFAYLVLRRSKDFLGCPEIAYCRLNFLFS